MKSKALLVATIFETVLAVALVSVQAGATDTHLQIQNQAVSRARPGVTEECVYFDPETLHVGYFIDSSSIQLVAAPLRTISKFESKDEAARTLNIIKQFGINELCRAANSKFSYALVSGKSPKGNLPGRKYVAFDPHQLKAKRVGNEWGLVTGKTLLFNFGSDESAAREALKVITYYGFNAKSSMGGDKGFVFLYTVPQETRKKSYLEARATPGS